MALLIHLSDLHLREPDLTRNLVVDRLVRSLQTELERAGATGATVLVTGDIFDSATDAEGLVPTFIALHSRIVDALGADTPMVVLPGNHDRRRSGLVGPLREQPFRSLARAASGLRIFVAGTRNPFLAEVVPKEFHDLPAHLVTYDSSYVPSGLLSAGGTLQIEDLLQVHGQLPDDGLPLILLLHHHLIPTPVTDTSSTDTSNAPRLVRWLMRVAVPALVAHGDREELTMTALGAGTALSTLHSFGRPVLLLHGHKHVPTARLLRGMTSDCGDLLLASAGTALRRERVHATRDPDGVRLWPSFNVIQFTSEEVRIEAVSFIPKRSARPSLRRQLAHVRRLGPKWELESGTFRVFDPQPRVRSDAARFRLSPSPRDSNRFDVACERSVELVEGARLHRYVEFARSVSTTRRIELRLDGPTQYVLADAACRTIIEAARAYGTTTAFESVELLCRYGAERATLSLSSETIGDVSPFASFTDLLTGRERPIALATTNGGWMASAERCPPRSMLRIYWPLA